jgi:DNA-binding GntR family transcriptional regulator
MCRYALELASLDRGFGPGRKDLVRSLRLALDHMSVAARTDDLDALVASDTLFHEVLIDVSGRRRLKDLWSMLNSQMGGLMRAEIDRQGIGLMEAVERHRSMAFGMSPGSAGLVVFRRVVRRGAARTSAWVRWLISRAMSKSCVTNR